MTAFGTIEEKKALQGRANLLTGAGFFLVMAVNYLSITIGNRAVAAHEPISMLVAVPIYAAGLAGVVLWFWGLALYSKSKGYSPYLAAIGVMYLIGIIILALLPDKFRIVQAGSKNPNSNYPR